MSKESLVGECVESLGRECVRVSLVGGCKEGVLDGGMYRESFERANVHEES